MRAFAGIVALLLALGIMYYVYTGSRPAGSTASPKRQIDLTGVRIDLLSIAQAERIYMATHGRYATLDELEQSGAISFSTRGRRGYTYSSAIDDRHFRITARPLESANKDWPTLSIDETGQVSQQ